MFLASIYSAKRIFSVLQIVYHTWCIISMGKCLQANIFHLRSYKSLITTNSGSRVQLPLAFNTEDLSPRCHSYLSCLPTWCQKSINKQAHLSIATKLRYQQMAQIVSSINYTCCQPLEEVMSKSLKAFKSSSIIDPLVGIYKHTGS